jgi:hypothetical protein
MRWHRGVVKTVEPSWSSGEASVELQGRVERLAALVVLMGGIEDLVFVDDKERQSKYSCCGGSRNKW